jgi:nucleotide-binding universal stress UspA family protein
MDLASLSGAVVVGLDESGASWLALDRGVDLAGREQRRLVVLNVAELGTRAYANRLVRRAVEQARRRDPAVEVEGVVLVGTDGDVLAEVTATAAGLVLGSRVRWPGPVGTWALLAGRTGSETGTTDGPGRADGRTRGRDRRCGTTTTATTTTA